MKIPKTNKRKDGRYKSYYLCPHHITQTKKGAGFKNTRPFILHCDKATAKHSIYPSNKSVQAYELAKYNHLAKHEKDLIKKNSAKPTDNKTIDELAKLHIEECKSKQGSKGFSKVYNSIRERTYRNYISRYIGHIKIGAIEERDLVNFFNDLHKEFIDEDLGSMLYLHIQCVTNEVFELAYNRHYIDSNPNSKRVSNTASSNRKNLQETLGESNKVDIDVDIVTNFVYFIQEKAKTDKRFIQLSQYMLTSLHLGTRSSETAGILIDDIDFKNKQVHINRQLKKTYGTRYDGIETAVDITRLKTSNGRRSVPLSTELINQFMKIEAEYEEGLRKPDVMGNKTLWQDDNANPLPSTHFQETLRTFMRNYSNEFKKIFGKAYRYKFHALRHSCISLWIRAGIDAYTVKAWAGHKSIQTTYDVYGHEIDSKQIKFNMTDVLTPDPLSDPLSNSYTVENLLIRNLYQ